jgi:hypothetical protein
LNAGAFVSEVIKSGQVWSIRDCGGFPTSTNASGNVAVPFWSSESRAQRIIARLSAYKGFAPVPIDLDSFLSKWLPGMQGDGLYCGLNWSGERATGYDMLPDDVMARFKASREL